MRREFGLCCRDAFACILYDSPYWFRQDVADENVEAIVLANYRARGYAFFLAGLHRHRSLTIKTKDK